MEFRKAPIPNPVSRELIHERDGVLGEYQRQFAAFATAVPAPKQPMQGEVLSSWRHMGEKVPRVASERQLKQVQDAQAQAVKTQAKVDELRNGTTVQKAALWGKVSVPSSTMAQKTQQRARVKKLEQERSGFSRGRDVPPPSLDRGPSLGI